MLRANMALIASPHAITCSVWLLLIGIGLAHNGTESVVRLGEPSR